MSNPSPVESGKIAIDGKDEEKLRVEEKEAREKKK